MGGIPPNGSFLPPAFAHQQIDKWLILEATNGGTDRLIAAEPGHIAIVGGQAAAIGVVAAADVQGNTPEESVVSNTGETTKATTRTTWESGKAAWISSYVCEP